MEKLDFEFAVVSTEKQAFQKELDKQDIELRKMTKVQRAIERLNHDD